MLNLKLRKAQEEMIGFALIIVIVAIILLVFLVFSIQEKDPEVLESYEVESFLQATLQYTTECRDNLEYLSVRKLISKCDNNEECTNIEKTTCEVLGTTLTEILKESWDINPGSSKKGYEINITTNLGKEILYLQEGIDTTSYKGSRQDFTKRSVEYSISFKTYY